MKIMLRTSGGRGEYEIAGSQGAVHTSDLNMKRIYIELFPGFQFDSKSSLQIQKGQGKPRIRLEKGSKAIHAYRLLSSLLLFKKPIRELNKTIGGEVFKTNYSIISIDVDVVSIGSSEVVLRPKNITAKAGDKEVTISVASRIIEVQNIIDSVSRPEIRATFEEVKRELAQSSKPLEEIENQLLEIFQYVKENNLDFYYSDPDKLDEILIAEPKNENDSESQKDSLLEDIIRMRMVKIRGPKAKEFSRKIKEIYRYQCVFSGASLPSTSNIRVAGVEAAHILPWATSGINSPQNGLCLNGLCHWAFDVGLLYLTFNRDNSEYVVRLNQKVRDNPEGFSVEYFNQLLGPIPEARLPSNRIYWPNPDYLDQINSNVIF
ncbi:MAG: HNH endonuclease [Fibrobacteria bacterium]